MNEGPGREHMAEAMVIAEDISQVVSSRAGDEVVLESVSFAVPSGALFCVSGPSGSGISTLLRIVTGMERPAHGRVILEGRRLTGLTDDELARRRAESVGIVFHRYGLIHSLTLQENVVVALELGGLVPRHEWRDRAALCLRMVDMQASADSFPCELSVNSQRRGAIARALANDPPLLVVDEPTHDLSTRLALEIFRLLHDVSKTGKTILYATHDRDQASHSTDHIELLDGRIVDRSYGTVPGLYA